MDNSEEGPTRIEKIKQHLQNNKKVYIAAIGSSVITLLIVQRPAVSQAINNTALIVWKPESTNVVITVLEKRACPDPIPVRYKETGEVFASIRRASAVTGINKDSIRKDIHGLSEMFEELPDTVFA